MYFWSKVLSYSLKLQLLVNLVPEIIKNLISVLIPAIDNFGCYFFNFKDCKIDV